MNETDGGGSILWTLGILWMAGNLLWRVQRWRLEHRAWQALEPRQLAPGGRVGWMVQCDDQPAHTRLRVSCCDDAITFDADWRIQASVSDALARRIAQAGWTGVDLADSGIPMDRLAGLVRLEMGEWRTYDDSFLRRLREELRLEALIVVRPGKVAARVISDECGSRTEYAQRTGLATDTTGFSNHCLAVLACEWHVFLLDPAADLLQGQSLDQVLRKPSIDLPDFHKTHRIDMLSADDLEPVRIQVMTLIDRTTQAVVGVLERGTQRRSSLCCF